MKKRGMLHIAAVAFSCLALCSLISCTSGNNVEDEGNLESSEQTVDAGGDVAPEAGGEGGGGDLADLESEVSGGATSDVPADETLSLDGPPPDATADAGAPPPTDDLGAALGSDVPPATDPVAPPPDEMLGFNDTPPPADGLDAGALPPTDAPPDDGNLFAKSEDLPPSEGSLGSEFSNEPSSAGGPSKVRKAVSEPPALPNIPSSSIKRAGTQLNRYYFARKGDTAKKIAELLYGDAGRAKDLKKWNKSGFKAGKVVYYASATQAEDPEMRSFYQERGLAPEEVALGKGETLTKLAKKRLGSTLSWKEIAIQNGLSSATAVEPGQRVMIYPDLGGAATAPVANATPPAATTQSPANTAPVALDAPQTPETTPPPVYTPPAPPMEANPAQALRKNRAGDMNLARLIQQNLFFIVMGLGISLLLLALLAINKRKQGRRDGGDFGDDAFATAGAKKRR